MSRSVEQRLARYRNIACYAFIAVITSLFAASLVAPAIAAQTSQSQQRNADTQAVRQAVLDYVEGVYQGQPDRIRRSVSPSLAKLGQMQSGNDSTWRSSPMTFDRLVQVAETYSRNTKVPADAPKRIDVYDVLNRTASVKLTALWGSDYMLLSRQDDGRWLITHVLWQSHSK